LFSAGSYSGSFSTVVAQTPNQTVTWDLTKLTVNGSIKVASTATTPAEITPVLTSGNISLAWPASQTGWELQMQTDTLTNGLSATNWVTVTGSTGTNQVTLPVPATSGSWFYRLVFP
jgi:hypothetical protein